MNESPHASRLPRALLRFQEQIEGGQKRLQLALLDHQGDRTHPGQPGSRRDVGVPPPRRNHHLAHAVDRTEAGRVHAEQPVGLRHELDLALTNLRGAHAVVPAEGAEALRRVVLVQHPLPELPDVDVLLAHGEQNGDVLLPYHVSLAELGSLEPGRPRRLVSLDYPRYVVAEHLPHRVLNLNPLHLCSLPPQCRSGFQWGLPYGRSPRGSR